MALVLCGDLEMSNFAILYFKYLFEIVSRTRFLPAGLFDSRVKLEHFFSWFLQSLVALYLKAVKPYKNTSDCF